MDRLRQRNFASGSFLFLFFRVYDQTNLNVYKLLTNKTKCVNVNRGSESLIFHLKFQEVRETLSTWIKDILGCHKPTFE